MDDFPLPRAINVSSDSSTVFKLENSDASTRRTATFPKTSEFDLEAPLCARYSSRVYVFTSGSTTSGTAGSSVTCPGATSSSTAGVSAAITSSIGSFSACSASSFGLPQLPLPEPPLLISLPLINI